MIDLKEISIYTILLIAGFLIPKIVGYILYRKRMKRIKEEHEEKEVSWPMFEIHMYARSQDSGFISRMTELVDSIIEELGFIGHGAIHHPCEHNPYAQIEFQANIESTKEVNQFADELTAFLTQEKTSEWSFLAMKKDEWGGITAYRSESGGSSNINDE